MNKNEMISAVADATGLTKAQASDAVEAVFNCMTGALKGGDDVRVPSFGIFSAAKRKATTARNPQTGATVDVPASVVPKFKPSKTLKDMLNA